MKKSVITAAIIILASISCFGQYDEKSLYYCYLGQDKKLWKEYVTKTPWLSIDNNERQRLMNYEYGYIAYAISQYPSEAKQMLETFNQHINSMAGKMPESTRMTYMAAAASYAASINKITILSNGPKAYSYSAKAVELDNKNPYALTLRGSVYFYCPTAFGGDKTKALKLLKNAEHIYRNTGDTIHNWNYRSVQMVIAQCYEKTGQKDKAIEKCRMILKEEPDFAYIRDCYLPELLGLKSRNENHPQNIGATFISSIDQ